MNDEGTHYLLNGSKIWISNGGIADIFTGTGRGNEQAMSPLSIVKHSPFPFFRLPFFPNFQRPTLATLQCSRAHQRQQETPSRHSSWNGNLGA